MTQRRSGGERGLELLRSDTNRSILMALKRAPSTEAELRSWLVLRGSSKLRRHLETLLGAEAIERHRVRRLRRRVEYGLTEIGVALVEVIAGVHKWLDRHPERELETVSPVGWRAFALLIDAWVSGVVKELAQSPRTVAELSAATGLNVARLNADLLALQGAGIVFAPDTPAAVNAYALSEWGILGIGVLALSSHWQRAVEERPIPVSVDDALIALSAALPLARLPGAVSGSCSLTIEPDDESPCKDRSGALRVEIRAGQVSVAPALSGQVPPDAWLRGTIADWLLAAVAGRGSALHTGGERELAADLLATLRASVYGD